MNLTDKQMKLHTVAFCCGIGGQTLGLKQSKNEYKGVSGGFEMLAGYDNDPVVCKNYELITGSKAVCADLFTREQYILFHGKEPGPEWEELTAAKVREQCGKTPDVVVMSPPCKGFSRLLPKKTAKLPKYQALNQLPERVFDLVLEAWFDDLPAILLMENVPGIRDKDRGVEVLKKIKRKLALRGYVFYEDLYDCGEWGGLGQHRVRYLLIARLPSKVPDFIFQPPKLPMKSIGDILGPLPLPGDIEKGGKMHRISNLAWRTWERLALIPAGKDWRALENFGREQWKGAWKIVPWNEPSNAVTSSTKGVGQSTGASAVADPRLEFVQGYGNKYRVVSADEPCLTVTGSRLGSGAPIYADPKVPKFAANSSKVQSWEEPSGTVIGGASVSNGALNVADPRIPHPTWRRTQISKVQEWDKPSGTITGSSNPSGAGSGIVADPRLKCEARPGAYGVQNWDNTAVTLTASMDVHNFPAAVSDPRLNRREGRYPGTYRVIPWNEPSSTVLGQTDVQTGAQVVADKRIRCESRPGLYGIADWNKPINTITGNMSVSSSNSVAAVADPRKWSGAGNYGVMKWEEPAKTITASGDIHAGAAAVADPRIPSPDDRGIYIIIAADGTWHRPITTYEMAMLQGFPRTTKDGAPFELVDCSDGKAREYIGNAVPIQTATAIGNSLLETLMPNLLGDVHFGFSNLKIWVKSKVNEVRRYFDNENLN
ncbi:MAG TPA: DNA cytosine methyltransferase [Ruminiclostridium sp.]|nr:DNA cytosine methyltransferase [Ruminiclostridium sp.]